MTVRQAKPECYLNTEPETLALRCVGAEKTLSPAPHIGFLHWWWVRLTFGPTHYGWFYVETVGVYKCTEKVKAFVFILYMCVVPVVCKLKLWDKPDFRKPVLIICEDVSEQHINKN